MKKISAFKAHTNCAYGFIASWILGYQYVLPLFIQIESTSLEIILVFGIPMITMGLVIFDYFNLKILTPKLLIFPGILIALLLLILFKILNLF